MKKTIRHILKAEKTNMGGHTLYEPLPAPGIDQIDPFLLIHHWDGMVPANKQQKEVGVGPHPHRGFSPVTFVYDGDVHHRDSHGGDAVIKEGGTQWMFAGHGLTHSERPSKELAANGGRNQIIQFWVNAPAKHKMDTPYYQPLTDEETPKIIKDGVKIGVVAGEYEGIKAQVPTLSPQTLLRVSIKEGKSLKMSLPLHYNTLLYVVEGKIEIDHRTADRMHMVWFQRDGEEFEFTALADTEIMVLSGEPIDEEVTHYGPFVMNTQTEILEALRDVQVGKMGVLIEEFD